jgi:hypothetical protein
MSNRVPDITFDAERKCFLQDKEPITARRAINWYNNECKLSHWAPDVLKVFNDGVTLKVLLREAKALGWAGWAEKFSQQ